MREAEFRAWLEAQGLVDSSIATRLSDARRVEAYHGDLDAAFDADRTEGILASLAYSAADAAAGRPSPSPIPIGGDLNDGLATYRTAVTAYGRFRSGTGPVVARQADRIRNHVLATMIEPARARGERQVEVVAGEVHRAMGLENAMPAVCSAIGGNTFERLASVRIVDRQGPANSSTVRFVFAIEETGSDTNWAEAELRRRYDAPSTDTAKMVGFHLKDGRAIALQRDVAAVQIWLEESPTRGMPPGLRVQPYSAAQPRHSNLPARLKHAPPGGGTPRRVALVTIDGPDELRTLLDWYDGANRTLEEPQFTSALVKDTIVPTNLILYGPPGTGKTYATARHAVRLCGEEIDGVDRDALMARYKALSEAGRIEFVTFHQSTAYEEFVEGLRPVQGGEGAAGFELQPTDGIFRRIAGRAAIGASTGGGAFTLGDRQVFKMSIGDATKAEWAWLFDEAIENGYAYLGFADVDWSDRRFAKRDAILAELQAFEGHHGAFDDDAQLSLQAGPVKSPDLFRNELRIGDVIVVSKGLTLFRAIGVVEGDYEYARRADGRYSHRRKVRWLWHDEDGVPVSELNSKRFGIETIHRLKRGNLNVSALERYANSRQEAGSGAPEPFVLVIDEINRANISKVFGELITLLEPDKRIGAENELRVRLPYSGDTFGVPANLHIVGTMNTADRSIALIDKALRRRFDFVEMMPDYTVRGMADEVAGAGVTLADVLATINDRIEYLLDREHQIGHGWLLGCDTKAKLDAKMRSAVIPLIAEYFFEDWGRTADVLGGRDANPFLDARAIAPPPGMAGEEPRVRWSVKPAFAEEAYLRLVAKG